MPKERGLPVKTQAASQNPINRTHLTKIHVEHLIISYSGFVVSDLGTISNLQVMLSPNTLYKPP